MCIGSRATMYTDLAGSSTMALVLPLSPRHLRDHALQTVQLVEGTSAYPTTLMHTSGTGPWPHDVPGHIEPLCSGGYPMMHYHPGHAMFKAALFVGVGVVLHASGVQDIRCAPAGDVSVWWW